MTSEEHGRTDTKYQQVRTAQAMKTRGSCCGWGCCRLLLLADWHHSVRKYICWDTKKQRPSSIWMGSDMWEDPNIFLSFSKLVWNRTCKLLLGQLVIPTMAWDRTGKHNRCWASNLKNDTCSSKAQWTRGSNYLPLATPYPVVMTDERTSALCVLALWSPGLILRAVAAVDSALTRNTRLQLHGSII